MTPTVTLVGPAGRVAVAPADVAFVSETQIRFTARAALAIAPGVYDVEVKNPQGRIGTLSQALTVTPPPGLMAISPAAICTDMQTEVTLTGAMFRDDPTAGPITVTIGTPTPTVLGQDTGAVVFVDAQTLKATVPAGLPAGIYAVSVTDALGCTSTLDNAFTVAAPPTLVSVSPVAPWNGMNTTITLTGTGFRMTPTVSIAMTGMPALALAPVTFVDAQTVTAVVPMGTPAGAYTLTLTNPEGCAATIALTVSSTAPIMVTKAIVPFGCSTETTPVTIDGSSFLSTPSALLVGAGTTAGTDLKLRNVAFVSSTRVTGLVPSGGKIGGPYDLKVTNSDGGSATRPMAFTVTKLCPPVIDDVSPTSVVHDYKTTAPGSTAIIIKGVNFRSDAVVVLVNPAGVETAFPAAALTITPTQITLNFDATTTNLTDGVYLLRVKQADDSVLNGGTGVTEFGDFSLFIVTNPSGKFQMAVTAKPLPTARRGHGVVGGQNNAAARYLYAIGGDSGGNAPVTLADGLFARLDLFGNIGDAGWQRLRKRAATPATGDSFNDLPSARTGVAAAQLNRWVYVVGGTTAVNTGAAPTPAAGGPISDVRRARILSAADAPLVSSSAGAGGTLAPGTYYYRVSMLVTAATPGYGPNVAETVASDDEVVTVTAGQKVQLDFSMAGGSSVPTGNIAGYRVYRGAVANAAAQLEVWMADVTSTATSASFIDDGSLTPSGAHPLEAGMLSEWESGGTMQIPRAYASVSLATPPATSVKNLYVVGGWSGATAGGAEATWELTTINAGDGTLSAFGPTGLSLNGATNCTVEQCMTAPRWALFASTVADPPSVTNPDTRWILAGAGALNGAAVVQEHAQIAATTGILGSWSTVATTGGGAFTTMSNTLGPIGIYTNAHVAIVGGYQGVTVSNKDEFGTEACSVALVSGVCPLGTDFRQTAKSSSTLGISPPVAFSGYTLTSGYLYVVGGSTDGINAVTRAVQGAQ